MRKRVWWAVIAAAVVFFTYVITDSIGVFNPLPYYEVPHGDHTHYVPKDRDRNVPIGSFPMRPPAEGERLTPRGEIVPID